MVDDKGFLKLIDLGTAKIIKGKQGVARTFTIIGTPHCYLFKLFYFIIIRRYGSRNNMWKRI